MGLFGRYRSTTEATGADGEQQLTSARNQNDFS
jgi:hypothetical protein